MKNVFLVSIIPVSGLTSIRTFPNKNLATIRSSVISISSQSTGLCLHPVPVASCRTSRVKQSGPLYMVYPAIASVTATLKLISGLAIGASFTTKRLGTVLDSVAISVLSKLTFSIFQPLFLFTSVASTIASALDASGGSETLSLQALSLMPVAAFLQISIGAILARFYTTKILGIRQMLLDIPNEDEDTASDVRMCATFANSGPLPLMFADALFHSRKGILNDVTACVSFYLLVWSPLFWTLGRIILGSVPNTIDVENRTWYNKISNHSKLILSPPIIGCLLGLLVGSQEYLRNVFLKGPLNPLFSSCKSIGAAYLPAALLVLAGSLVGNTSANVSMTSSKIKIKTVMTLCLSRFLLAPTVAVTTMKLLSFFNILPTMNPRSLAIVTYTMLMEGCMPPAQNSVVMLQLDGKRDRAAKMAKLLTIMYTIGTGPITLLLSACLAKSGILKY